MTVVFVDAFREIKGRTEASVGVPVPLPSFRGMDESRRTDWADAVREVDGSIPGVGDGMLEPTLAAAAALRT